MPRKYFVRFLHVLQITVHNVVHRVTPPYRESVSMCHAINNVTLCEMEFYKIYILHCSNIALNTRVLSIARLNEGDRAG